MKKILFLLVTAICSFSLFAQSHTSTQSHQSTITNIVPFVTPGSSNFDYVTTGEDGFIIKWTEDDFGEHYQVTDLGIKMAVCSPNGKHVAVYETDGGSTNKVTVWDWQTLTKKFSKTYNDSITTLNYSANGTYLIIGTATTDSAVFVRTSDWKTVDKIKENTSIVNYVHTSASEKTIMMYSPAGSLSYYAMNNGKLKTKFKTIQGLTNVVSFNNDLFLAGLKDDHIYVIYAMDGKSILSIPVSNAVILTSAADDNLYYLEFDGKNIYTLKMLDNLPNNKISNPHTVKTFYGPRTSGQIVTGTRYVDQIVLGGKDGAVYKTDAEPMSQTVTLKAITDNTYTKIVDSEAIGQDFYFLSSSTIYKSSYDTGIVETIASVSGETNITAYENKLILWSKGTRNKVTVLDLTTKARTDLFTPKGNIQSLKVYGNNIVEIENNSVVNIFNFETKKLRECWTGSGIQDAVLADDGKLYIGKSAHTAPNSALLCVDTQTMETVPLSINANVAYGFSTDGKIIYGIKIEEVSGVDTTFVFSFNTVTRSASNILKFADEDPEAFTTLDNGTLFTNIGKNKVYSYNLAQKKRFSYNRSASIPLKVTANGKRVVILNRDGSISWCNATSQNLQANWYLTVDNQWFEF
ncbi:MAG: hypothetical protein MJ176_04585 [Treponema sp.]|nr:hypothetical protein [Treponema sp.]